MDKYFNGISAVDESFGFKLRTIEKQAFCQSFIASNRLVDPPHIDIEPMFDYCREYAVRLSTYIWSETIINKTVSLDVKFPETWWDAFKERFFDCENHWFWKKHKPKYKLVTQKYTFKSIAKYPSLKLHTDEHQCVIHEMMMES